MGKRQGFLRSCDSTTVLGPPAAFSILSTWIAATGLLLGLSVWSGCEETASVSKTSSMAGLSNRLSGAVPGAVPLIGHGESGLKLILHDRPIAGRPVEKVMLDVRRVSVIDVAGEEFLVSDERQSFDLLELVGGITRLIGFKILPPGKYAQIRLQLGDENYVISKGKGEPLKIPSGQESGLKLSREFELKGGFLTAITLDFDAEKSILWNRGQGFILKPVVQIISVASLAPDTTAPGVTLGIQDGLLTRALGVSLPVAIDDAGPVTTAVLLNGEQVFTHNSIAGKPIFDANDLALQELEFTAGLSLIEGPNSVEAISRDYFGNEGQSAITLVRDTIPPRLVELRPGPDRLLTSPLVTVSGRASESLASAVFGGSAATLYDGDRSFTVSYSLSVPGDTLVGLVLTDRAGNSTSLTQLLRGPTSTLVDVIPSGLAPAEAGFRLKLGSVASAAAGVRRLFLPIADARLVDGTQTGGGGSPPTIVDLGEAAEQSFALAASAVSSPGTFSEIRFNILPGEVERLDGARLPVGLPSGGTVSVALNPPVPLVPERILDLYLEVDVQASLQAVLGGYELRPVFRRLGSAQPTPAQSLRLAASLGSAADFYVSRSDAVVEAKVIRMQPRIAEVVPGFQGVVTSVTVQVLNPIKGSVAGNLVFDFSGGRYGTFGTTLSHGASFEIKEGSIVLLQRTPGGQYVLPFGALSKVR